MSFTDDLLTKAAVAFDRPFTIDMNKTSFHFTNWRQHFAGSHIEERLSRGLSHEQLIELGVDHEIENQRKFKEKLGIEDGDESEFPADEILYKDDKLALLREEIKEHWLSTDRGEEYLIHGGRHQYFNQHMASKGLSATEVLRGMAKRVESEYDVAVAPWERGDPDKLAAAYLRAYGCEHPETAIRTVIQAVKHAKEGTVTPQEKAAAAAALPVVHAMFKRTYDTDKKLIELCEHDSREGDVSGAIKFETRTYRAAGRTDASSSEGNIETSQRFALNSARFQANLTGQLLARVAELGNALGLTLAGPQVDSVALGE